MLRNLLRFAPRDLLRRLLRDRSHRSVVKDTNIQKRNARKPSKSKDNFIHERRILTPAHDLRNNEESGFVPKLTTLSQRGSPSA
jgi:hypothetical protein